MIQVFNVIAKLTKSAEAILIQRLLRSLYSLTMTIGGFFFFSYLFYSPLFALEIPKRPEGYVSDYAGMISSSGRMKLEEKLRRFEEETSNQVIVVTFPSLEEESLEDFSIRLAEAWKIGQKEKNNGVILLIFKAERKVRIEVGYGLEGALPDATSKVIIENEIVPRFREGKFDEGIEKAVDAIIAATKGEYQAQPASPSSDWSTIGPLILWLFMLFFLIFRFYDVIKRSSRGYVITRSGRRSYWRGSGGFGGGGGGFSGGGGGFGGGGASGRW